MFPRRPWLALWLRPFTALQLIVSHRYGDESARFLAAYHPLVSQAIERAEAETGKSRYSCFAEADRDLQDWCAMGLIRARGRFLDGAAGLDVDASIEHWSDADQLDYWQERYAAFGKVRLSRDDILAQIKNGDVGGAPPAPEHRTVTGNNQVPPTSDGNRAASRRGRGAKAIAVRKAVAELWPAGIPDGLPAKVRNIRIVEKAGPVSFRQIERTIASIVSPTSRDK